MTKKILALIAVLVFAAGAASAAVVITLNNYRNVTVTLEPIGLCGSSGDCVFNVMVNGTTVDSTDSSRSQEFLQFRSDDAAYNLNQSAMTTIYRRSRKAWKAMALADNTD